MRKLMGYKVNVEQFNKDHLVKICREGYLDVIVYDEKGDFDVFDDARAELMGQYTKNNKDIECVRISLETAFRYY